MPGGGFLVAEADNNTVRRVSADGTIRTVAGTGDEAFAGDGGPATQAKLDFTHDVAALPHGGFLIADMNNRRIRRVSRSGQIGTVAGDGNPGPRGDGGPATRAQLNYPHAVAPLRGGGFLIANTENDEVRRVLRSGRIMRVAGTGARGYGGDGGPAAGAQLDQPFDVAPLHDGGFLIAEAGNDVIRKVSSSGRISTVAGTGVAGSGGDGGRATVAQLDHPHSVASLPGGGFLIADTDNHRIPAGAPRPDHHGRRDGPARLRRRRRSRRPGELRRAQGGGTDVGRRLPGRGLGQQQGANGLRRGAQTARRELRSPSSRRPLRRQWPARPEVTVTGRARPRSCWAE